MKVSPLTAEAAPAVLAEIWPQLPAFWGERDLRSLHHPLWWRQFGADAVVAREDGLLQGYLAGVIDTHGLGYVHLIATRLDRRGQGLGRRLYEIFLQNARDRGADRVEAITTTTNSGSIAFHRKLGFSADVVPDYSGPGQARVLLCRTLPRTGEIFL